MKVKTYPQGGAVQARPDQTPFQQNRATPDGMGGNIAQALNGVADDFHRRAMEMKAEEDEAAAKELDVQFNRQLRDILHNSESGYYGKRGKDAFESYQDAQRQLDELRQEYEGKAGNDEQRSMFGGIASRRVEGALDGMSRHAANERRSFLSGVSRARQEESINDAAANYTDPQMRKRGIATAIAEAGEQARLEGWSSEVLAQEKAKIQTRAHAVIIDRMLANNPQEAFAYFQENQDGIEGTARAKIERVLNSERSRMQAEQRANISSQLDDYVAYLRDGNVDRSPPVSKADVEAAYGEKGEEIWSQVERAQAFGQSMAKIRTASPEELQAILQQEQNDLDLPDGYRVERKEYADIVAAIQHRNQQIEADPAEYVLRHFPETQSAYHVMSDALSGSDIEAQRRTIAAYTSLVEEAQTRLGIEAPVLLTDAYAQQIAKRFNDHSEGGEKPAEAVQAMSSLWGDGWPRVMQQLNASKLIPRGINVIAAMSPGLRANQLSEALKVGKKEYAGILDKDQIRTIEETVKDELIEFQEASLGMLGQEQVYNQFVDASALLAMKLAAEGEDPSRAAEIATGATINDRYTYVGSYRIPSHLNAYGIEQGVQSAIENAAELDLKIPDSLHVANREDAAELYRGPIAVEARTLNDDSGILLVDPDGKGAVLLADGSPAVFSWEELQQLGLEQVNARRSQLATDRLRGMGR
ncbi:hypothetical protein [Marinobacterium jannaschii]|uniref:hypothetical protein n=1 Tax=Marinobacterium jannaschii TaxID=64970 RepID=UPI0004831E2B|nr:hypothetical protein [Marinobacterium jannaschii]